MPRLVPLLLALLLAAGPAGAVGFQQAEVLDPVDGRIPVALWYPSEAPMVALPLWPFVHRVAPNGPVAGSGLPVVVISHGAGGSLAAHRDTAQALASAGFVVLALSHPGDTFEDQRLSGTARGLAARTRQLHRVLDWLLREWPARERLDPARIGAFGFSAGGFTVLVAAGGEPDLGRAAMHCAAQPADMACRVATPAALRPDPSLRWVREPRLRALVVAAPALGWAFIGRGLAEVRLPVQLWRPAADEVLTHPWHAELIRRALPTPPELYEVARAGHYAFLVPCPERLNDLVPEICVDPEGFDRIGFRGAFNAAVVAFFRAQLR